MPPPTIARLKSMGALQFRVTCSRTDCRHSSHVTFEAARVGDEIPFPEITERRRFVCTRCAGHVVSIMPDWSNHSAQGVGRI